MERIGPVMIGVAAVADVFAAVVWIVIGDGEFSVLLSGAAMLGLLLTFGGTWLTILWGEADRDLLIYSTTAIGAHVVALLGIAFLPLGPIVSALLFLVTAGTVVVAAKHSWRTTTPSAG